MSDFEKYREDQRRHWKGILKGCEASLRKALFPEKLSKEFYESNLFKESGLCGTRLGDDYYMYLQIALNSYKYNLQLCEEELKKLDELTEEDWRSQTRQLFAQIHKSEFSNRQYQVGDRYHDFRC